MISPAPDLHRGGTLDLKRLQYFCTIEEQGSISKAAKLLNMAQPPLGKRLQEMENEIGPLCSSAPRGEYD
ncbi:helix-turn-helix domain-containing protein [Sodalis glossinidius]|uniref:helix-turn-helix domain-containing protein n=1 Tax=Sodalis glossinidius TaxID=63612 RepID=UPI001FB15365|nr:LysR family transcriptional regulator [Sodalis glossinidius]